MLTKDGVSTTKTVGSFRYEQFYSKSSHKWLFQWDYRDIAGDLHSGVSQSLEKAREAASLFGYGRT
jgi:hypothetical protein